MLDRAAGAASDIQLRRDDLACLADLQVIGRVARIHRRARSADGGIELVGDATDVL